MPTIKCDHNVSVPALRSLLDVMVAVADANTFGAAMRLLRGDTGVVPAAVSKSDGLAPDDVIAAVIENRVVGAVVSHAAAGRVGWIWPPVVSHIDGVPAASVQIGQMLIAAATAKLADAGCRLAQALIPSNDSQDHALVTSGYVLITEMIRMVRDCREQLHGMQDLGGIEFFSFEHAAVREFEEVIDQTYCGSQDCPELDGIRTVSESLESYRSTASFRPDLWQLARRSGHSIGCVLLASFPDARTCELQYMGVVPRARGQQIGRLLCERALVDAARVGACELMLSVDSRNHPAINHYRQLGFHEIERRRVHIRKLQTAGSE
jgi:ribosomal protein S18 acetylase RimI-like enzyme